MLVIDLRSENEFEACHMKYKDVISFPADKYLSSGTTFSTVSSLISRGPSKGAWDTRGDYEAVVLLDQSTNSGGSNRSVLETLKPSHPLLLMKDAVYKWDAQHVVKTEPVVLDGGMQEFLLRYAPLTTNPDYCVHPPNADGTESSKRLLDVDNIDYPDIVARERERAEAEKRRAEEERRREEERIRAEREAELARLRQERTNKIRPPPPVIKPLNLPERTADSASNGTPNDSSMSRIDSSTDLLMEERLRRLRNVKPKTGAETLGKGDKTSMPTFDRNLKPASYPNSLASSSKIEPDLGLNELTPDSGPPDLIKSTQVEPPPVSPHHNTRTMVRSQSSSRFLAPEPPNPISGGSDSPNPGSLLVSSQPDSRSPSPPPPPYKSDGNASAPQQMVSSDASHGLGKPLTPVPSSIEPHSPLPSCHLRPQGLRNLGNTCYMNAVLQSLAHNRALATFFLRRLDSEYKNVTNPLGYGGEVSTQFQRLFSAMWSGPDCTDELYKWKAVVGRHRPSFAGCEQQDSLEFLLFLLDGLHEDMNEARSGTQDVTTEQLPEAEEEKLEIEKRSTVAWTNYKLANKSVIVSTFQGQLLSSIQCRTCLKRSSKFDAFMCLSLPLPDSSPCTLQACVKLFGSPEEMTGLCQWLCPQCKRRTDATKQITVFRLPRYLIVHFKRFHLQQQTWRKRTTDVAFPINRFEPLSDGGVYALYAVLNHYGTMESGHYTAFCRGISDGVWYEYDDSVAMPIPESRIQSNAAYILFYELLPRISVFSD
ncbi:unnamed protein product [Calicophoron daubneyi]